MTTLTVFLLLLCAAGSASGCVFAYRNELVFKCRSIRHNEVSRLASLAIHENRYDEWKGYYREFELISYDSMLVNFRCWTYKQFYPEEPKCI